MFVMISKRKIMGLIQQILLFKRYFVKGIS